MQSNSVVNNSVIQPNMNLEFKYGVYEGSFIYSLFLKYYFFLFSSVFLTKIWRKTMQNRMDSSKTIGSFMILKPHNHLLWINSWPKVLISVDILNKKRKSRIDPEGVQSGAFSIPDCTKVEELYLNLY